MKRAGILLLILTSLAAAAAIVIFFNVVWHWVEIHTGTVNESGPYYGFWSGFGSDLGEVALLGGLITVVRHQNCHQKGCYRLGRRVEGTPYIACHVHHPAHEGKRNVTGDTIAKAHESHLRRTERAADPPKAPTAAKKAPVAKKATK